VGATVSLAGGPGECLREQDGTDSWAQPKLISILNFSLLVEFCKLTKLPLSNSKIYLTFWGGRINKKEQLFFWAQIQNPNEFWITNLGSNQDLNLVWIFRGIKPLDKNLNNSSKFSLDIIFMNVNLDDITCMQKFEDPTQVTFGINLIIQMNLNMIFELGFTL
jgi:hypothetical protein